MELRILCGGDWRYSAQQVYSPLLFAVLGLCGYWRFLSWLSRRYRTQTGWRAIRIVWPTFAVAAAWLAILAGWAHLPDGVVGTLGVVAVLVNLPMFLALCLVADAFDQIPPWLLLPVATAASWFLSYAIVLFFERRAQDTGPIRLGI